MPWEYAHIGLEDDGFRLDGIDIWHVPWERVGNERVRLPHPAHLKQQHDFDVYEVELEKKPVRFAFTELSVSVYGFYKWCE